MILLPVIERELILRARQRGTYWSRCAVAALATVVGLMEATLSANTGGTAPGLLMFRSLAAMGFFLACGCALVTADCISRERRDGTLGLLLLTDLKSLDVVLGKLFGAGVAAFYALIGFLPVLGFVFLIGGVTGGQAARTALAVMNAFFVFLAAGIWVSARAQSRHNAMRGAIIIVLLLCIVPRILMHLVSVFTAHSTLVAALSPYQAFLLADDSLYNGAPEQFWISLAISHASGWVLLAWTARYLSRTWAAVAWQTPRAAQAIAPVAIAEAQALATSKELLLRDDPICWAVSRLRIQNALIWVGTLLLLLGGSGFTWGTLFVGPGGSPGARGILDSLHLLTGLGSAALLAWAAGRFFFEARRNGELEMIVSTPLGAKDIVAGNWRAICKPLRGAWLLVAFLVMIQFIFVSGSGGGPFGGLDKFQRAMIPVTRILDIIAIGWVGMWFGLRARKPLAIMAWTVGLVVGLPWIVTYVFVLASNSAQGSIWAGAAGPAVILFWFLIWPVVNIAKNIFFVHWAAGKLRTELRTETPLSPSEWFK